MATLLLVVIYIAFIGLGIPDSLFGTAWPLIYRELNLPVSLASFVSVFSCACSIVSSLMSGKLVNRFGINKLVAASTALTAAGLLGYTFSQNAGWFFVLCIPLGFGAGAIDSALNNYVAVNYNATHMSFLHCFYGVGVSLSPFLMSLTLRNGDWRGGYRLAFYVQLGITAVTVAALPLWGKVKSALSAELDVTPRSLKFSELVRLPGIKSVWLIFMASCTIECISGSWGSTFLVNAKGMDPDAAALVITFYYVGMSLGRFLSGILAARLSSWRIIGLGCISLTAALVLLILPIPNIFAAVGLFMVGLGNGPLYPNMVHLTPQSFGEDVSQSVMGSQMAAAYIGIMVCPSIFGLCTQAFGAWIFPWFLLAAFAILVISIKFHRAAIKLNNKI